MNRTFKNRTDLEEFHRAVSDYTMAIAMRAGVEASARGIVDAAEELADLMRERRAARSAEFQAENKETVVEAR
jgi:hypothetical protein